MAFKNSIWRPVATCGGAFAIGLLIAPILLRPVAATGGENVPEIVLPGTSTLILKPTAPPGALLRGQLRLVADMTGASPITGEVARQLVDSGARVKKGDPVIQISSGALSRAPSSAESTQSAAEKAQITVADNQTALSQKIVIAQSGLRAAQDRVDRAQAQVGAARDLVRRLQNGETVSSSQLPSALRQGISDNTAPEEVAPKKRHQSRANTAALKAAQTAHDAAKDGAHTLAVARKNLTDAEKAVQDADEKLKTTTKAVVDTEARFDDKKASAADVEAARTARKEAQATVNSALRDLATAQTESTTREKAAAELQKDADKAQATAAALLKDTHLFDETPSPTAAPASSEGSAHVTLDEAARFATAALEESRRATRDAEKMRGQIDSYQKQVSTSQSQTERANRNLEAAQQSVLDSTPRPRFTPVLAPDDGVVTWVARLAREVSAGDSVFGLSRGTKVNASFEDKQGLWKNLKKGIALTAFVSPPAVPVSSPTTAITPSDDKAVVTVKVTDIVEPVAGSQTATISAEVTTSDNRTSDKSSDQLSAPMQAGDIVMASVANPNAKATLSVPTTALVERGGAWYLGVLKPAPAVDAPGDAAQADTSKRFVLDWEKVRTGRTDGLRQEIVSGVTSGTRIVAVTTQLDDMNLLPPAMDAPGKVKSEENATPEFVIRVTTS